MNKYPKLRLFTAGFFFGDAINHFLQAINNSPFSVHGIRIGISGNWIIFIAEVIIIFFLLKKYK